MKDDMKTLPSYDDLERIQGLWQGLATGTVHKIIAQIKDRRYPDAIKEYGGEVLLVGINYDKNAPAGKRKHECVIEKMVI